MPREPQPIPAKGSVLRWARNTRGYSVTEAARRLGIHGQELNDIENERKPITAALFRKMITLYQRVESDLLLPFPPDTDSLPQDYRTIGGAPTLLSPDTLLAIREARRIQHYVTELVEEQPELIAHANITRATMFPERSEPEQLAAQERLRFRTPIETQRLWGSYEEAFRHWREQAQDLGILVLIKKMPWEDCRGLSLWEENLIPTIVVNPEDALSARIFTLFHEYAHLMLSETSVCVQVDDQTPKGLVERWCNSFAASFLMPEADLKQSVARRFSRRTYETWTLNAIGLLAAEYRVSRVAMARRLREVGISNYYDTNRSELYRLDKRKKTAGGGGGGGRKTEVERLTEVGTATASVILDAVNQNITDVTEAADVLELRLDQLERFRRNNDALRPRRSV